MSDEPNEQLTAERALELANYFQFGDSASSPGDRQRKDSAAKFLRAFAEQATINDLADALLIYGQHYLSCDGSIRVDDCCECGLSDWLAKTRKLRPEYERAEDSLEAHREIAERDRTIKDLRRDLGVLEVSRDAYADTNIELRAALAAAEEKLKAYEERVGLHGCTLSCGHEGNHEYRTCQACGLSIAPGVLTFKRRTGKELIDVPPCRCVAQEVPND